MARLKVFLNKKWISSLELQDDRKLFVGRSRECDFVMEAAEGISRKHFTVFKDREGWVVERLSKIENLSYEKQQVSKIHLKEGVTFSVGAYEFAYQTTSENTEVSESRERTVVMTLPINGYLQLSDESGHVSKTYELQGSYWLAGRDPESALFIDSSHVSRKQFEMQKNEYGYQIRHLGSTNPTKLNGDAIGEDWVNIVSGDVVSLGEARLLFEIRRSDVVGKVAPDMRPVIVEKVEEVDNDFAQPSRGPVQFYEDLEVIGPAANQKKKKLFVYSMIGLCLMCAVYFASEQQDATSKEAAAAAVAAAAKKDGGLSPEKLASARQLYLTAQALLSQGKYELAKEQVQKLHQIVPQFEDSKEIEATALQGLSILADRERALSEERERLQIEAKLKSEIEKCRGQMDAHVEPEWLDSCLTTASSLNPEAPEIAQMKASYQEKLTSIQMKKAEAQERLAAINRQKGLFLKAQNLEKNGSQDDAIELYEKIAKGKAMGKENVPGEAKRRIASIQDAVIAKQVAIENESEDLYKKGDLKGAVARLREGLKVDSDNEVVRGKLDKYEKELTKKFKDVYQQSVLEESYGDVASAKVKWKKILEDSTSGEPFYEKARAKLKKYGDV